MDIPREICELIFPKEILRWFEFKSGKEEEGEIINIVLEEKDMPPLSEKQKHKRIIKKKFHTITVTDFPLRGRRTTLTLRRRYWQLEGECDYIKRDLAIAFPGTKLENEFASFLKEASRNNPDVAREYRRFIPADTQGI
jgi:transposase